MGEATIKVSVALLRLSCRKSDAIREMPFQKAPLLQRIRNANTF
jgi:hypothetical protein